MSCWQSMREPPVLGLEHRGFSFGEMDGMKLVAVTGFEPAASGL